MASVAVTELVSGDCDYCPRTEVHVVIVRGDWMCDKCLADEAKTPSMSADAMLTESRIIDSSIQIKTDVFNAKTVPAIELKRAIDADDSIPVAKKNYAMARESLARYRTMKKAIFDERQAFLASIAEKENEARMWQTQVQTFAGMVSAEERREFQNFDVSYQPEPVKSPKSPATPSVSRKKIDMEAINAAAAKYGVSADAIQFTVKAKKGMSIEDAAIRLAGAFKQASEPKSAE